jgi:L-threonylcarbamoyladenylate synthase
MLDQEKEVIELIAKTLRSGGICIVPTEVGLEVVCDGTNESAVSKVLACFNTHTQYNFSLLIHNIDQLGRYTRELPEVAEEIISVSETPLTLILPTVSGIASAILIGKDKAPFRIVSDGLIGKVLRKINKPLLSIPATDSLDRIPTRMESIPQNIIAIAAYISPTTSSDKFTAVASSAIELGSGGQIKIIRH